MLVALKAKSVEQGKNSLTATPGNSAGKRKKDNQQLRVCVCVRGWPRDHQGQKKTTKNSKKTTKNLKFWENSH